MLAVPASAAECSTKRQEPHRERRNEASPYVEGQPHATAARGKPSIRRTLDGVLASPRANAVQQLVRIEHEAAYAGRVAGRIKPWQQSSGGAADRDARFVKNLVAGVTRWRRRLDFVLDELTGHRVAQMDPVQLVILRLGLYELVELGLSPHAISEHVDLAKALVFPQAAGFTNGVLRSAARARDAGTLPAPPLPSAPPPVLDAAAVDALAVATSHPTWMVARWAPRFGPAATLALLQANNREPEHGVRVCSAALRAELPAFLARMADAGVQAVDSRLLPGEFVRVSGGLQQLLARTVVTGADCQVQDEAAGLVVALLDPQPGEAILDACAAPGGKTLFAAARMGQGRLLALDRSERKLRALRAAAREQGVSDLITTHVGDLREFSQRQQRLQHSPQASAAAAAGSRLDSRPEGADAQHSQQPPQAGVFDRVLLDVPCSGSGVLAKRADLRWRREPSDLAEMTSLQAELLDAAAPLVRPGGGVLVYSTCSIEPEENQQQVESFLARRPDFVLDTSLPELARGVGVIDGNGYLQTLPHLHGCDGAFAARFRRVG